jgi:hypothetical protein
VRAATGQWRRAFFPARFHGPISPDGANPCSANSHQVFHLHLSSSIGRHRDLALQIRCHRRYLDVSGLASLLDDVKS